jgi:sporulation protein YlmC with PRC-barrel domain
VDEDIVLDQNEKKVSYLVLVPNSIEIGWAVSKI